MFYINQWMPETKHHGADGVSMEFETWDEAKRQLLIVFNTIGPVLMLTDRYRAILMALDRLKLDKTRGPRFFCESLGYKWSITDDYPEYKIITKEEAIREAREQGLH